MQPAAIDENAPGCIREAAHRELTRAPPHPLRLRLTALATTAPGHVEAIELDGGIGKRLGVADALSVVT
jgi:hypothetical protein